MTNHHLSSRLFRCRTRFGRRTRWWIGWRLRRRTRRRWTCWWIQEINRSKASNSSLFKSISCLAFFQSNPNFKSSPIFQLTVLEMELVESIDDDLPDSLASLSPPFRLLAMTNRSKIAISLETLNQFFPPPFCLSQQRFQRNARMICELKASKIDLLN